MSLLKLLPLPLALALFAPVTAAPAQISVGVNLGPPPGCPYGYFDYAPYNCSPYGYYGPDWFSSGIFIGAGPWFHGSRGFYGHVDNRFDPRRGYNGPFPERGEQPFNHFHANEARDGGGPYRQPGPRRRRGTCSWLSRWTRRRTSLRQELCLDRTPHSGGEFYLLPGRSIPPVRLRTSPTSLVPHHLRIPLAMVSAALGSA